MGLSFNYGRTSPNVGMPYEYEAIPLYSPSLIAVSSAIDKDMSQPIFADANPRDTYQRIFARLSPAKSTTQIQSAAGFVDAEG